MKTKLLILASLIFISIQSFGQKNDNKLDVRLGVGISLLGSGDKSIFNYENEFNLKLNQYFTSSASINLGHGSDEYRAITSFVQENLNIFISPFKNNNPFDLRIGTGLTYYNISEANYIISKFTIELDQKANETWVKKYELNKRSSFGVNGIIEGSYMLTDKFLLGLKVFTQVYSNNDINSGVMVKFGLKM